MASKRRVISDIDEILEYIMDDDSADDELIESELSSEDDFEAEDTNAPDENCENNLEIVAKNDIVVGEISPRRDENIQIEDLYNVISPQVSNPSEPSLASGHPSVNDIEDESENVTESKTETDHDSGDEELNTDSGKVENSYSGSWVPVDMPEM